MSNNNNCCSNQTVWAYEGQLSMKSKDQQEAAKIGIINKQEYQIACLYT